MGGLGPVGLWVFLVVVIAVSILLAVGSIWLAHHSKLADSAGREENSALSPFLTCVALVFGALLGFTVVVAWEQFSSAETHVANEASTLTTMYRQTVAMPVWSRRRSGNCCASTRRRPKVRNGPSKRAAAAQVTAHEPRSRRCIAFSVASRPARRRALLVNFLVS
jgi:hypothetical protein